MIDSTKQKTSDNADRREEQQSARHDSSPPQIVELGPIAKLTGKGRQYEDGRKYDERQ